MDKYLSKLDTERFGFLVAKVNYFEKEPIAIIEKLISQGVKLIISRVDASNILLINKLEAIGFRLKDVQQTFSYDLDGYKPQKVVINNYSFRTFKNKDTDSIVKIARESFKDYGHYYANEHLDKNKCAEIYTDWAYRSCTDNNVADHIIVAEYNNEAIGFLSFKINTEQNKKFAAGGMGAVSNEHRKYGIFRAINICGLNWGSINLLNRVEHNVLVTNYPVNKTYIGLKFNTIRSELTLHYWNG